MLTSTSGWQTEAEKVRSLPLCVSSLGGLRAQFIATAYPHCTILTSATTVIRCRNTLQITQTLENPNMNVRLPLCTARYKLTGLDHRVGLWQADDNR